jgi:CubicO group peptidase (beta-lactamase class C family)
MMSGCGAAQDPRVLHFLQRNAAWSTLPNISCSILAPGGAASFPSWPPAAGPHVAYKVGSLAKLVTALTLADLESRRIVDLDCPASRYIPWLDACLADPGRQLRLVDLLAHTAGLPRGLLLEGNPGPAELRVLVEAAAPLRLGVPARYSNIGYMLLGGVIEAVTGLPFAKAVTAAIMAPLGLVSTGYGALPKPSAAPHEARCFVPGARRVYEPAPSALRQAPRAAMDLHTTAVEFAVLLAALLPGGGGWPRGRFAGHLARLRQLVAPAADGAPLGPGFRTEPGRPGLMFECAEHFGHSAALLLVPARGMAIAVFANRASASAELATIAGSLARHLGGDEEALMNAYPRPGAVAGAYAAGAERLAITRAGPRLFAAFGDEAPSPIAYVGGRGFVKPAGARTSYPLLLEMAGERVRGVCSGPLFFDSDLSALPDHATADDCAVVGTYRARQVGRLAVFYRDRSLRLAFSPGKEACLESIGGWCYVQRDGPFCGDRVDFDPGAGTMRLNGLTFAHSGECW